MLTREQALADYEAGLKRFDRLIPPTSDTLTVVLKSHLLIEEQMQSIIEAAVHTPELVRTARLTFYQRLKLAQAIAGHFSQVVAWDAIESLNSIRNRLVHAPEPAPSDELLAPFLAHCNRETRLANARQAPEGLPRLRAYLAHIWVTVDVVHDVIRVVKEKMPLP
ncbi:MAG: hypothetical protein ACREU5_09115 [Burkholderiales bacterium]